MGCKDRISDRCTSKINAVCVKYEGTLHENTELDTEDCHDLEEVIEDINAELDAISEKIDLTDIDESCIDFDKEGTTVTPREALLALTIKIKEVMEYVGMSCGCEECEPSCNPIFTEDISCLGLDYKCLVDPCGNQPANLKELLQIMITALCPEE